MLLFISHGTILIFYSCLSVRPTLSLWLTKPLYFPLFLLSLSSFSLYILSTLYPPPPYSIWEFYLLQKTTSQASPGRLAFVRCFSKRRKEKKKIFLCCIIYLYVKPKKIGTCKISSPFKNNPLKTGREKVQVILT